MENEIEINFKEGNSGPSDLDARSAVQIKDRKSYVYRSDYIYLILGMFRPGAITFLVRLEHNHFLPKEEKDYFPPQEEHNHFSPTNQDLNDRFTVHLIQHRGQHYSVIGVPMGYLDTCHSLAKECKLKLLRGSPVGLKMKDGCTTSTDVDNSWEPVPFPIDHSPDLTYTVQNIENYTPDQIKNMIWKEKVQIQAYFSRLH